jgi:hypothetical protein
MQGQISTINKIGKEARGGSPLNQGIWFLHWEEEEIDAVK